MEFVTINRYNMFDRWTSDIAEVKTAASNLHSIILAEMDAGVKASINSFVWLRQEL